VLNYFKESKINSLKIQNMLCASTSVLQA